MKRKWMNKILFCALAVSLVLATVACSGTEETAAEDNKTAVEHESAAGEKTVVNFWHSFSSTNGELLDKSIAAFNASQDEVEVVGTYQGTYDEVVPKAQAAVSAGEIPDIMMTVADYVGIFSEAGIFADLKPYMAESGINEDDFIEGFVWDYYIDDKMIAIPFGRSTPVLFVNKDMMKEVGLETPTTWEEMDTVCNALVVKDGDEVSRYGVAMPYDTWYFFMGVDQAGGSLLNEEGTGLGCIEDGTALKAFTYYQDMANSNAMYYGPTTDSNTVCRQLFLDGKAAMFIASSGNLAAVHGNAEFDYELAWLPEGEKRVIPTGGCSLAIMEGSQHKDAAWKFFEWLLTDPEGITAIVLGTGYLPITYSMAESAPIQEMWKQNPNSRVAFEQLEYASDKGHRSPEIGAIITELYTTIQAVMYDNEDVKTQLDMLAKNVEIILAD